MCEFKKKKIKMVVYRLPFFFCSRSSLFPSKMWEKAIVSDSHGLERGCDLVPHIITPLCISSVFSVNSKLKVVRKQAT